MLLISHKKPILAVWPWVVSLTVLVGIALGIFCYALVVADCGEVNCSVASNMIDCILPILLTSFLIGLAGFFVLGFVSAGVAPRLSPRLLKWTFTATAGIYVVAALMPTPSFGSPALSLTILIGGAVH